jgi:hypothetical protein
MRRSADNVLSDQTQKMCNTQQYQLQEQIACKKFRGLKRTRKTKGFEKAIKLNG